jgi:hypothetical protein
MVLSDYFAWPLPGSLCSVPFAPARIVTRVP